MEAASAEVVQVGVFKKDKNLLCPRCLSMGKYVIMKKKSKFKIIIDKCPSCQGFFLDKGEQEKIIKEIEKQQKKLKKYKNLQ